MPNLSINPQRLWDTLMETAEFGGTAKGGVKRLTLSDEDKQARDWFKRACEALGCSVTVDQVGNIYARRSGKRNDLPPIAMGSHLDTQPTGGKFDGILGVLAGLEALRTLHETGYETNAPIEIINWTNEEGSRFAPGMLGSAVVAGVYKPEFAWSLIDRDGSNFGAELERIGYKGDTQTGGRAFSAMFELHIEQGPILDKEKIEVGVVTGMQGMRWYEVTVTGESAHTGATPMTMRKNALLGSARMVDAIDRMAHEMAPSAVATVGMIENMPNSRNVVPGEVFFTIDMRHPDDEVLQQMEDRMRAELASVLTPLGLSYEERCIWSSPAVKFSPELIECVRIGAKKSGYTTKDLVSGAGHDAAFISRIAPTTMIFAPCLNGISHNEAESSTLEECAAGTQTMLNAVLEFDSRLG
ncbi:MAG: M20 family metallo-hydrolase [Beijerinckiaceae bacterium]|nr:M20 family metallo-hydrolase [Beijerinckiaceae bacterium]